MRRLTSLGRAQRKLRQRRRKLRLRPICAQPSYPQPRPQQKVYQERTRDGERMWQSYKRILRVSLVMSYQPLHLSLISEPSLQPSDLPFGVAPGYLIFMIGRSLLLLISLHLRFLPVIPRSQPGRMKDSDLIKCHQRMPPLFLIALDGPF